MSVRRHELGVAFALVSLLGLTWALLRAEPALELSSVLLLYLGVTVIAGAIGGRLVAAPTGVVAVGLAVYYFTAPARTLTIDDPEVVVAVVVFALITAVSTWFVDRAARRSREVKRSGEEAAALVRLTTTLAASDDPLPDLVTDLVGSLGLDHAAVLRGEPSQGEVLAEAGWEDAAAGQRPRDHITIDEDHVLVLTGDRIPRDDRRVLTAYAAQLAVALTAEQLSQLASAARLEAETNRLRAALLSSVSHDLRTPLTAIKALASSLEQEDVTWQPEEVRGFAHSIVEEADRLHTMITNLLDLSRLSSDSVPRRLRPVGLDELVPVVVRTLAFRAVPFELELPPSIPPVRADPLLLERIVTNLVDNAVRWSPSGEPITIRSRQVDASWVELTVSDRGPGIPVDRREHVFEPFQRLHDHAGGGHGVGLGLAVARGLTRALDGHLTLTETTGGGTTAVLRLPAEVAELPAETIGGGA